jgi:transcriptional regulator with XRE-family HTH domain
MEPLRELGALVRRSRADAGLSGVELARRAGVPQPSVSRLESGRRLEDVAVVERLVSALTLDAERAAKLVELARRAYAAPVRSRVDAGVSVVAGHVRRYALAARRVRSFSAATIPAFLRTPEYARAAADNRGQGADLVSLADMLGDAARSFTFVVTEGALRTWPGSVSMVEQLARVGALMTRANVRLGVIPWALAVPRVPPHDFTIFDDDAVWVETFTAELTLTHAADLRRYAEAFTAFQRAAVYGEDARAVISRAVADIARVAD